MPDKINVLKICAILTAGALSLGLASRSAESYAAEVATKEKTLAEAIIRSQMEEELRKAEEKLKQELEKKEITIVTTSMETKPPVTEPPETEPPETDPPETEPPETEPPETEPPVTETTAPIPVTEETDVPETEADAEEEIVTEFTRGGILPKDRTNIPVRSMLILSGSEQKQLTSFLVEHYFLDGFVYSENETRAGLKEKKALAAEMESNVVKSFNLITSSVGTTDITAAANADYGAIREEAEELRDEFREKYADAGKHGEQFATLYDDSLRYFDRLVEALGKVEQSMDQYKNAANPLLALGLLTSSLNDVIIPEVMAVLEQSFDLVELTQDIFLEGTQGTKLLSRDEVRDIIENPGLAFYVMNNV